MSTLNTYGTHVHCNIHNSGINKTSTKIKDTEKLLALLYASKSQHILALIDINERTDLRCCE